MSTNKDYLKLSTRKMQVMNQLLGVKSRVKTKKTVGTGGFQLDNLHKRLQALPDYDSRQDRYLCSHFAKKGVTSTMVKTGVMGVNSNNTYVPSLSTQQSQGTWKKKAAKPQKQAVNLDEAIRTRSQSVMNNYNSKIAYSTVEQLENYYQNQVMEEHQKKELKDYSRGINKTNNSDGIVKKMQRLHIKQSLKALGPSESKGVFRPIEPALKPTTPLSQREFTSFLASHKKEIRDNKSGAACIL